MRATRNAPSRWRLRPAFRPTAAEATAARRAIDLGRSVLGAVATLWGEGDDRQGPARGSARKLRQVSTCDECGARRPMRPAGVGVVRPEEPTGRAGGNRVEDSPKIGRVPRRVEARRRKCTEPVAPSSGFPTDRRRSGCRSESHQPRVLRTRCNRESTRARRPRQAPLRRTCAICVFFFLHRDRLRLASFARDAPGEKKGPGPRAQPTSSPSRERFRPPSRRTFRFRVVLLGGLRPTGAPCSAQRRIYEIGQVRSRPGHDEVRAICGRLPQPIQPWPFQ
jgi:hypothetical protein